MTWNPCCCLSLRTGVFLIGILEIVITTIAISWTIALRDSTVTLLFTISMSKFTQQFQNETDVDPFFESATQAAYIISGVSLSACAIRVIMACVLLLGVQRNSTRMIGIWIFVKIVTLFFAIGTFVASLFFVLPSSSGSISSSSTGVTGGGYTNYVTSTGLADSQTNAQTQLGLILFYAVNIGASVYFIWVAYSLVKELRALLDEADNNGNGKDRGNGKGGVVYRL